LQRQLTTNLLVCSTLFAKGNEDIMINHPFEKEPLKMIDEKMALDSCKYYVLTFGSIGDGDLPVRLQEHCSYNALFVS